MANPALRTALNEADAKLASLSQERLTYGDVLTRVWTDLDATQVETLFDTRKAASLYYTDPQADGLAYEGRFVRSDLQVQNTDTRWPSIAESLTLVYDSDSALPDAGWQQSGNRVDNLVAGDVLIRDFPFVSLARMETQIAALRDGSLLVVDPVADGETFTGTFVLSDVRGAVQDGRWATIRQILTKINVLSDTPVAADLPTPVELEQKQVLNQFDFALADGTMQSIGYEYPNMSPVDSDDLMALDISSLAPAGYTESDRRFRTGQQGDRTGALIVLWRKPVWDNELNQGTDNVPTGYKIGEVGNDSENDSNVRDITVYPGVDIDDAETALERLKDATTDEQATHRVGSTRIVARNEGSATISRIRTKIYSIDTSSVAALDDTDILLRVTYEQDGTTVKTATRTWPNITQSDADDAIDTLETAGTFTVLGQVLQNIGLTRRNDPDTGLITLIQDGIRDGATFSPGNYASPRPIRGLDEDYAEQYFIADLSGVSWRATVGRTVGTKSAAIARANQSTLQTNVAQPQADRNASRKTYGRVKYHPNIDKWEGISVTWELGSSLPTPYQFSDDT